jgi:hypothetical protein
LPEEPPSPFKPISEKRIARAKRARIALIIVIVVLVAALGALGYLGFRIITQAPATSDAGLKPTISIPDDALIEPSAPSEVQVETIVIPELVGLYGLTIDEIKLRLGDDWSLVKTDEVIDPSNTAIQQLATFSFTVHGQAEDSHATAALPAESIYASLNAEGACVDIYYSCDLRLLGYPQQSFNDLLASPAFVLDTLSAAGIAPREFTYTPPDFEASIEYDNSVSANRKIMKQTTIFSGRIEGEGAPVAWTLTVTYDYGLGVSSVDEHKDATRTIYLKIA